MRCFDEILSCWCVSTCIAASLHVAVGNCAGNGEFVVWLKSIAMVQRGREACQHVV